MRKNYYYYNNTFLTIDIDIDLKYKRNLKLIVTPTRKCGSVFYPSLVIDTVIRNSYDYVNEDHNKEYPPTKFKQFSTCGFGEISSQHLTTST